LANGFLETLVLAPRTDWPRIFLGAVGWPLALLATAQAAPLRTGAAAALIMLAVAAGATWQSWRRPRLQAATLDASGEWRLRLPDGAITAASLTHAWGAGAGWAMGFAWRDAQGNRWWLWLLRSDLSPDHWRRLRVRLRIA
jgi:hypothetical protein